MAETITGASRTLSALNRRFAAVTWQAGKPPLDSELNLMAQVDWERMREFVRSQVLSGFFLDPTAALSDFEFLPAWSNHFRFGRHQS